MLAAVALIVAASALAGCKRATPTPTPAPPSSREAPSPEAPPAPSASVARPTDLTSLRPGDLVFQTSRSAQSRAVQLATRSPLSHMGVVLPHAGGLSVFEAVGPVKYTPVAEWVARGEGGRVLATRLRASPDGLSAAEVDRLAKAADAHRGKPYDAAFGWSDDRMYCSEIVWKIYQRALGIELGRLSRLGDFDLENPVVRDKLRERYGAAIPVNEPVISPAEMAASPLLETVIPF